MDEETTRPGLEDLLCRAWPEGLGIEDLRTLTSLSPDQRERLADRLEIVLAAGDGSVAKGRALAVAERAGLAKAMTYRLVARWRKEGTLASVLPYQADRRRESAPNALSRQRRADVDAAIRRSIRLGGRQQSILKRAVEALGKESPSRSTLMRAYHALSPRTPSIVAGPRFQLDVAGTMFATEDLGGRRFRMQLCVVIDTETGSVLASRPCLPADILPAQTRLIDGLASEAGPTSDATEKMRWTSPETMAEGRGSSGTDLAVALRFRTNAARSCDVVITDGYGLGASLKRLGNRIGDVALSPRLTGARGLLRDDDRSLPLLSLEEAGALFADATERHNRSVASASKLRQAFEAAAGAARNLKDAARQKGQSDVESLNAR